jgi:Glycosyltransferases, probably involved in cell wall biogenesis
MLTQILLEIMSAVVLFLLFFWLFIYYEILNEGKGKARVKNLPRIAMVIPTLFEGDDLRLSVESVLASDYPRDKIKIYVGLNKATDEKTRRVAHSFGRYGVEAVDTGVNGKAAVMNYVLKHKVKEEFVATLDADSMADRKMLRKLIVPFSDKGVGAVAPSVAVYNPKKAVQLIQKYDYIFSIVLRKAFSHVGNLLVAPGPGSMFRLSALKDIGYFDERNITEDMEVAIHLLTEG